MRPVRKALAWLRSLFRDLRRIVAPSEIDKFRQAGWNELIYGSVDHGSSPVIVVFGGFTGESCAQWTSKWPNAQLFVYEPVPAWAALLKERFRDVDVRVFEYGVGARSENRWMFLKGDASSALPQRSMGPSEEGQIEVLFKSVAEAAGAWPFSVDTMEINIEGGEYELIQSLSAIGLLERVVNVFVQFHDVGQDTEELIGRARARLESTHELVWSFHKVWDFWRRSA